jgi:hypothetical protein
VLEVTSRPPEDFESIARRYAVMPRNRRTVANGLRELARFLVTPLTRRFDLDRYDRELRRPFPSAPQFAPESAIWQREHAVARTEGRPPVAPARHMLARR